MICGPRYTIIDRIPYDRDNTAMIDFPMCEQCEEEYTTLTDRRYHAQTISCLHDITDALFENHIDVRTMRDVTRGGLGTIMNEIAETSGCRFNINEEDVPVNEEVKGFCGILGLDPFYMGNEGKLIAVVSEEQAVEALEIIRGTKHGKNARIIGEAVEGSGVYVITKLGGSRVLDMKWQPILLR